MQYHDAYLSQLWLLQLYCSSYAVRSYYMYSYIRAFYWPSSIAVCAVSDASHVLVLDLVGSYCSSPTRTTYTVGSSTYMYSRQYSDGKVTPAARCSTTESI